MAKEILYTSAVDERGRIVLIKEAVKGRHYYCPNPNCNGELGVRDSGNTGKWAKRPHFYHKSLIADCTPEGVLHLTFKKLLIGLLEQFLSESKPLNITWNCNACFIGFTKSSFEANLLAKTATVKEEYNLKVCQPDIALLDADGKVMAVIEIVVTHKPEEDVLQYYERNGIIMIQINLLSDEDLGKIEEKVTNPDIITFCLNPECSNFKNYTSKRKLIITDTKCNRCHQPVRTCYVQVNSPFGAYAPPLAKNEIREAQLNGVRFRAIEDNNAISCLNCEVIDKRTRMNYERMRSRYRRRPL